MTTLEVHDKPAPRRAAREDPDASTDPGQLNWEQVSDARKRVALTVKDSFGRDISVGHVSAFDRMTLAGMVTPEESASTDFMIYATLAFSVRRISEFSLPRIVRRHDLDSLCQQLDDEGFAAVWKAWIELGWFASRRLSEEESAAEESAEKAHLKNSAATPLSPTQRG